MKRRKAKLRARKLTSAEHRSDRRTAEFVAMRIGQIQEDVADLVADMRTLEHYSVIHEITWFLSSLQKIKRKYETCSVGKDWDDE